MFELVIKSELDSATAFIDAILDGLDPKPLREVAGEVGAQVMKDHLYDLAAKRHRPESGQANFWVAAADATSWLVDDASCQIVVDHVGVAQRRYGGDIEAQPGHYLWIPVHPDAVGHTPGDFYEDLHTVISPLTGKGVAINEDFDEVYFALVKAVHQDPDESVDPDRDKMFKAISVAQAEYLEKQVAKSMARTEARKLKRAAAKGNPS